MQALVNGGAGVDLFGFAGARADYNITSTAGGYAVLPKNGSGGGMPLLVNVELFKFSDTTVNVEYDEVVQALYVAYFGRAADAGGMRSFQEQLDKLDAPHDIVGLNSAYGSNPALRQLVDSFGKSAESDALYPDGVEAFVGAVYKNVLGRSADADGLAFWSHAIDSGVLTQANAALSIMAGALENTSPQGLLDARRIDNTLAVASDFTLALDRPTEIDGYAGSLAASIVRAMLATVSAESDLGPFQSLIKQMLSIMAGELSAAFGTAPPEIGMDAAMETPLQLVGQAAAPWHGGYGGLGELS
jgi:serralysin